MKTPPAPAEWKQGGWRLERWSTNLFHTDWDIHVGAYIIDKDTFNILQLLTFLNSATHFIPGKCRKMHK